MNKLMQFFAVPLMFAAAATNAQFGGSFGVDTFEESIPPISQNFNLGATLNLTDQAGEIVISEWSNNTILITATKKVEISRSIPPTEPPQFYLDQLDVEVSGDADEVNVVSVFPASTPLGVTVSIDYDITIPEQAVLDINNTTGLVEISGIAGSKTVEVNIGNISVTNPAPAATDVIDLKASTSSSVALTMPATSAFDVSGAITIGGIVVNGFPLTVEPLGFLGAQVNGSVNGGGATVNLEATTGQIELNAE